MGDSYRPSRRELAHAPPLRDRMTFSRGGGDSYRPRQQDRAADQAQFTFESSHTAPRFPPTGPAIDGSQGTSRRGPGSRENRRGGNASRQRGGRNNANGFGRGGFRKAAPHERALLQQQLNSGPEQTLGVSNGPNRFHDLAELSDNTETGSDKLDDSQAIPAQPAVAVVEQKFPKWSNPDPYTVLPPPDEQTGKKRDFVHLIRKAKNEAAAKAVQNSAVAANDDFISFGDNDHDEGGKVSTLSRADREHPSKRRKGDSTKQSSIQLSEKEIISINLVDGPDNPMHSASLHKLPDRPQKAGRSSKRRREDDVIAIVPSWQLNTSNPIPWAAPTYAHLASNPSQWLHNEILDFYDFVAPHPFEHDVRHDLIDRVSKALGTMHVPNVFGELHPFGSFPAGLYLPTADMDLVYCSSRYWQGGPAVLDPPRIKKALYSASRKLTDARIAAHPQVIAKAKVPIIKFKDRVTGLQVDISFENLSGVQAQATFSEWKQKYPDLTYLVALLKQFLVMRDLNEVASGGIGGFAIICLVVSYIQHTKEIKDLGDAFLGLLKYYGDNFDLATQRIQMHPPAIVRKTEYGIDGRAEKPEGLSIQDPNRLDNNISGGSYKAKVIFDAFSQAHEILSDRMHAVKNGQNIGRSLLSCLIGGNYESYHEQRHQLKRIRDEVSGSKRHKR